MWKWNMKISTSAQNSDILLQEKKRREPYHLTSKLIFEHNLIDLSSI